MINLFQHREFNIINRKIQHLKGKDEIMLANPTV